MPIVANKTDTFFMAACMQGLHSFLCIGVIQDNQSKALIEMGKAIPFNERNRLPICINEADICCEMIFNTLHSELLNEKKLIHGRLDNINRPTSYVAYEFSYENYLQLLRALKQINPQLCAYIPTRDIDNIVTFNYQEISNYIVNPAAPNPIINHLNATKQTLSFSNSCRSTVVELSRLSAAPDTTLPLPNHWYQSFACKNTILNSQFTEALYLLPTPPSGYHLDSAKHNIISTLYKQLEKVLAIHPKDAETRENFESLKTLYTTEAGKPNQTVHALIQAIKVWRENNPYYSFETSSYYSRLFCRKPVDVVDQLEAEYGIRSMTKLLDKL